MPISNIIETAQRFIGDLLQGQINIIINGTGACDFAQYVLLGEYGLLTMTPRFLLLTLCPLIVAFTFVQQMLLKSDGISRVGKFISKPLSILGLTPPDLSLLLLGAGCTTGALSALNQVGTHRERIILAFLLSIAVPCSAQLSMIAALALYLPPKYFTVYAAAMVFVFVCTALLLNLLLPGRHGRGKHGKSGSCKIMTSRRGPQPCSSKVSCSSGHCNAHRGDGAPACGCRRKTHDNSHATTALLLDCLRGALREGINFLKENTAPFMIGSVVISVLTYFKLFYHIRVLFRPVTVFLCLPVDAADLMLMSMVKRDLGAAAILSDIYAGTFSYPQLTVVMAVLSLFVPCFASVVVLVRKFKPHIYISIWLFSFAISVLTGKIVMLFIGNFITH